MRGVVTITGLAYGPHGVGRLDGKVVFVRGVVPGEQVEVVVREDRGSFAYADAETILSPSPDRRTAPCRYLPRCGGCPWQHVVYEAQLRAKEQNLRDHLTRTAGLRDTDIDSIVPSPQELGYRSRLSLRTDGRDVGFSAGGTHDLVAVDACLLGDQQLNAALPAAAALVRSLISPIRRIEIVRKYHVPGVVLVGEVEGSLRPGDLELLESWLGEPAAVSGAVNGVVLHGRGWRRCWGDEWVTIAPEPDLHLVVRAGAFTQVNPLANQKLVQTVVAAAGVDEQSRVLDLYAGVGNLSLPLARRTAAVVAVEQNRLAAQDAQRNARGRGMKRLEVITATAHAALRKLIAERRHFDVVVLDPPRSGAAECVDALLTLSAPVVVYVSCNPATLARDLKRLATRYRIDRVQPLDLFPQTYHAETVVRTVLTC